MGKSDQTKVQVKAKTMWRIVDNVRGEEPDPGARYDYEPKGLPSGYHAEKVKGIQIL
jgi:hypothetical protein